MNRLNQNSTHNASNSVRPLYPNQIQFLVRPESGRDGIVKDATGQKWKMTDYAKGA